MSAPVLAGPVLAGSVLAGPGLAGPVPADPVLSALLAGAAAALLVPGRVTPRAGRSPGAAVLLAGATGVVLLLGPPARVLVAAALLGLLAASAAWILRARRQASAARATAARVRESCESLAEELTAGAGPDRALARAARDWPSLGPVLAAHRVGLDVPTAWRRVAEAPGAGGLRLVAAAWQVSGRTGQGLAAALSRVAEDLRAGEASRRVVASELASARATGRLVAGLPVLAWLMGSGSGGDPLAWLLGGPAGWACLALGGGLLLGGLAWIELLARSVER